MFREMRRKTQLLPMEESLAVLRRGSSGVLAVSGDDGYPYAVPLSYVYHDGRIYFHCATAGHKLDSVRRHSKASFCVIDEDRIVPDEYTSYFRSVIVFGTARILEDQAEKRSALVKLAARYSPEHEPGAMKEIDKLFAQTCVIELNVEHLSGKEAIELVRLKRREESA